MRICYTLPGIAVPHGGYRIVLEHLTRLMAIGHDVFLFIEKGPITADWYGKLPFLVTTEKSVIANAEIVVIGSPHSIWVEDILRPGQRGFVFMQMVEHLFRPHDQDFNALCQRFYNTRLPIIHGSDWGFRYLRKGKTFYLNNGVNFEHFPLKHTEKDGKTVLIEGWEASNPAKDKDALGPRVAKHLKEAGYKIIAFGHHKFLSYLSAIPDEYYCRPDLETMNELYSRATILLKATRYDARALSPMEAMTKKCVTVRALIEGDDDLEDGFNCYRTRYNFAELKAAAFRALENQQEREAISERAFEYVQNACDWHPIIHQLNVHLTCD